MITLTLAESAPPYTRLGRRIAELRNDLRWSQRELAEFADVSIGYIARIETGRNRPDPNVLRRIARALSVDYTDLATLAGFADAPAGNEPVMAPADVAPFVRRMLHYPVEVWASLEATAGAWVTGRPKPKPDEGADEPGSEHRE